MHNKKSIMNIYNLISDDKIDESELLTILPKLYLIMNKVDMDEIEIVRMIDTLREIRNKNRFDSVTPELVDLIIKTTKNDIIDLEDTLYFDVILKNTVLPYNENICDKDYNLMLFLSGFELYLEFINQMLKKKDLVILDKYNHELVEIIKRYKQVQYIYKQCVVNDVILSTMISHFASMLYFNLEEFDYDYDLLTRIVSNIINNYQKFIDYCCSLGLHKNFTRISTDLSGIEKEYSVSYDMMKYLYKNEKNEKIKRK